MRLYWTDNVCTVGKTCVCGHVTLPDMAALLEMIPEGEFTACFPLPLTNWEERLPHEWEVDDPLQYWAIVFSYMVRNHSDPGLAFFSMQRTFYFTFPDTEANTRAVAEFNERMAMSRGENMNDDYRRGGTA